MYLGRDISNDKAGEKKHDMFDDGRIHVTTRNLPAYRTVNLDNRNDIQDDNDTPNVRVASPFLFFRYFYFHNDNGYKARTQALNWSPLSS